MSADVQTADSKVLQCRAARLAKPPQGALQADAQAVRVLEFTVAGQACALELAWLRHVRLVKDLAVLPLAVRHVQGIVSVRGQFLALIDLAGLLGLATPTDPARLMLVFGGERAEFGLAVQELGAIARISWTDVARRSAGMKEFQPAIAKGTTGAGHVILDSQALLALGKNAWGAAASEIDDQEENQSCSVT